MIVTTDESLSTVPLEPISVEEILEIPVVLLVPKNNKYTEYKNNYKLLKIIKIITSIFVYNECNRKHYNN